MSIEKLRFIGGVSDLDPKAMSTDQTQLHQTLKALQKAFSQQLGYAQTPELKSAVEERIALVGDWIAKTERSANADIECGLPLRRQDAAE